MSQMAEERLLQEILRSMTERHKENREDHKQLFNELHALKTEVAVVTRNQETSADDQADLSRKLEGTEKTLLECIESRKAAKVAKAESDSMKAITARAGRLGSPYILVPIVYALLRILEGVIGHLGVLITAVVSKGGTP